MNFEFATAGRIIFGPGRSLEVGALTREFGQRAALLTGANADRHPGIRTSLEAARIIIVALRWTGRHSEPDEGTGYKAKSANADDRSHFVCDNEGVDAQ